MRQLPILFSTPMVKAIQENRKTMTRRTAGLEKVNDNPDNWEFNFIGYNPDNENDEKDYAYFKMHGFTTWTYIKPRYQVGEQLYVKETFCLDLLGRLVYRAKDGDTDGVGRKFKWISSLFMRKEYARLWLEVTGVRCERLFDITESDALSEGVEKKPYDVYVDYLKPKEFVVHAEVSFFRLWEKINGRENTKLNPWVFVYTFKRIEKP